MLYAVLGISQAIFTFLLCVRMNPNSCVAEITILLRGVSTDVFSYFASRNLHHDGILNIFHAPMSFFDTTVSNSRDASRHYLKLLL